MEPSLSCVDAPRHWLETSQVTAPNPDDQPRPLRTKYNHHGPSTTAILRTWAGPDAVKACRLCPCDRCCCDSHLQCLIVVDAHIPAEACSLYREDDSALGGAGPAVVRLHVPTV